VKFHCFAPLNLLLFHSAALTRESNADPQP